MGDLVYLHHDASKLKSRTRYLVTAVDNEWVYARKFTGNQLRNASYKVKRSECFKVPTSLLEPTIPPASLSDSKEEEIQSTNIVRNQVDETQNTNDLPHQQVDLTNATYHATHEVTPAIPDVIVPQEPLEENDLDQSMNSHPQHTRRPVEN